MELEQNKGLYGKQLAENIKNALPTAKAEYSLGRVYLYLPSSVGEKASLKGWLYTLLDILPEIEHPLERILFVVYQEGSLDLITLINPSKFDVTALNYSIERGLNFDAPRPAAWELEPLPLDHPYYKEKDWLKKQPKRHTKQVTFEDIKELPNVKSLVKEMRDDGVDI